MRVSSAVSALVALVAFTVPTSALLYNVSLNSQVHLAYAGSTGMTVSWNTFNQLANPTVMYGLSQNAMNLTASSNISVTYPSSLTYNNHVKITGLTPNTTYYFTPLDLLTDPFTRPPYQFKTARVAGDMTPYSIAVVIDMGTFGPEGVRMAALLSISNADIVKKLSTSAGTGVSTQNVLKPGEQTTISSLVNFLGNFEFLMHRKSDIELPNPQANDDAAGDIAYADACKFGCISESEISNAEQG